MIELRTLGALDLKGPEGADLQPIVAQPKRLALLVYLALSSSRGAHRRDSLVALFWPELDQERARAALRQAVWFLRQGLHDGVLVGRSAEELALSPEGLWCDAIAFDRACETGLPAKALELYRGDFLSGFFVSDASPDFEHWVEGERARLRQRAGQAAWALAEYHLARGEAGRAADCARRAASLARDDEAELRRLVEFLDGLGDRMGALHAYADFAQRLAQEFEAEPSSETRALIQQIRSRSAQTGPPYPVPTPRAPADPLGIAEEVTATLGPTGSRRAPRRLMLFATTLATAAGLALLAFQLRAPAATTSGLPSVAVLYLDDLSHDTTDAYLADGLTEEITARLGEIPRLQVKSRSLVRRMQDSTRGDLIVLGHALHVHHLVEGSLRRAGARVRVSVRLVRAQDGFQIWGQEYDRATTDLLALEQDVAGAVATAIAGQLLPTERASLAARPTTNLVAYDHFLRGNYYLAQRTPHATARAIEEYKRAVGLDSDFVEALFRLANGYGLILDYGWQYRGLPPESILALGVAATDRALQKDSTSGGAWLARGGFLGDLHPRTLDGVLEADRHAISSDPRNAHAYDQYGLDLATLGDDSDAVAAWRRSLALDPDQPAILARMAVIAFWRRRTQDAIRWEDSTLAVDPGFHNAYAGRGLLRLYQGDTAGARADAETALRLGTGDTLIEESALAMIDAREDDTSGARARLSGLLERPDLRRPAVIQAAFLAPALVAIRENTKALDLLERVPPSAWFAFWLRSPFLDPLRSDPRFKRLVEDSRAVSPPSR